MINIPQVVEAAAAAGAFLISAAALRQASDKNESEDQAKVITAAVNAALSRMQEEMRKQMKEISDQHATDIKGVEIALAELNVKIEPMWRKVALIAATEVHSPHRPELDALLERFRGDRSPPLDAEGIARMIELLNELLEEPGTSVAEHLAAAVIIAYAEEFLAEETGKKKKSK